MYYSPTNPSLIGRYSAVLNPSVCVKCSLFVYRFHSASVLPMRCRTHILYTTLRWRLTTHKELGSSLQYSPPHSASQRCCSITTGSSRFPVHIWGVTYSKSCTGSVSLCYSYYHISNYTTHHILSQWWLTLDRVHGVHTQPMLVLCGYGPHSTLCLLPLPAFPPPTPHMGQC